MKKSLFLRIFIISAVVILLVSTVMAAMFVSVKEQDIVDSMDQSLQIMVSTVIDGSTDMEAVADEMKELSGNRITIVASDGTVLGDSDEDAAQMENHGDREEIQEALATGYGMASRKSDTFLTSMLYVAVRSGDNVFRMARSTGEVVDTLVSLWPIVLVAVVIALAAALILARYGASRAVKPLTDTVDALSRQIDHPEEGQEPVSTKALEEITPLIKTIGEMSEDITRAKDRLSVQMAQTRFILDNMEQGLVFVNPEMKILLVNRSARNFLGESQEVEGLDFIHLSRDIKLYDSVTLAVKEGRSCIFDMDLRRTVGAIVSVNISPVRASWISSGPEEHHLGAVVLLTDVTQTRQMEQMRSQFVANASHELKTPITSIKGFAELLAGGLVKDERKSREYLLRIRDESERMTSIIEDILKISSLEAEEYHPPLTQVDLLEVAKEAVDQVSHEAQKNGITVTAQGESVTILAFREDVFQMISNLVDNAVKYNRPGGYVKVQIHREGINGKIVVEDNGIGIAREHQGRIFERFYRVDKGRSRKIGGTGLGLSIVKHVAANLGGEISLRSEEGRGTTIAVRIPLEKE